MNFAIIEDSRSQAEVFRELLKSEGHRVELFADGHSFMEALRDGRFDFFIVDWALPDISGEQILLHIRERCGWDVPVVFCTARTGEEHAADTLRLGADDYIPKPIRHMEFMARIESLLRRCRQQQSSLLRRGNIEVDLVGRRIRLGGADVDLTQREHDLAVILLRNIGRVLTREELLTVIWRHEPGINSRTVDTHASRLRKKLGLTGEGGLILTSVYGRGYRLDSVLTD